MRSAEAARSTAGMIEGTVHKVKGGSELVERSGREFSHVASSISKVGDLVREIAAASNEQAQGIDQISRAVSEMDRVIQLNATNAGQSADASAQMNAQVSHMKRYVADITHLIGEAGEDKKPSNSRESQKKEVRRKPKASCAASKSVLSGKQPNRRAEEQVETPECRSETREAPTRVPIVRVAQAGFDSF